MQADWHPLTGIEATMKNYDKKAIDDVVWCKVIIEMKLECFKMTLFRMVISKNMCLYFQKLFT